MQTTSPEVTPRQHIPGPHPRPDTKNSTLGFPLPREDRDAIVRLAAKRGTSITGLMNEVIRDYLLQHNEVEAATRDRA